MGWAGDLCRLWHLLDPDIPERGSPGATVVRGHLPAMLSGMEKSRTALERAFALAKSGACSSVDDVKRCLRLEGYQINQIVGSTLARQLRTLIAEARGLPIPETRKGRKRRAGGIGGNTVKAMRSDGRERAYRCQRPQGLDPMFARSTKHAYG